MTHPVTTDRLADPASKRNPPSHSAVNRIVATPKEKRLQIISGPESDSVRLSVGKNQGGQLCLYANTTTADTEPWELIRFHQSYGRLVGEICSDVRDPLIWADTNGHLLTIDESTDEGTNG